MFFELFDDKPEPPTPEQLEQDLRAFEETVREMERDFPEIALARKKAKWRWFIEQHEQGHSIH